MQAVRHFTQIATSRKRSRTHTTAISGTILESVVSPCVDTRQLFYSPEELVTVGAVRWATKKLFDKLVPLDLVHRCLATVDRTPSPSEGRGILWKGFHLLWSPIGQCV